MIFRASRSANRPNSTADQLLHRRALPNNRCAAAQDRWPGAWSVPHANAGASLCDYADGGNAADKGGVASITFSDRDQLSLRYAHSAARTQILSIAERMFPVSGGRGYRHAERDHLRDTLQRLHVQCLPRQKLTQRFDTDKPLNKTSPRSLGFNYDSTRRRVRTAVPDRQRVCKRRARSGRAIHAEHVRGARFDCALPARTVSSSAAVSADADQHVGRHRIERLFVFAPFPASDSFASFLLGFPWSSSGRRR